MSVGSVPSDQIIRPLPVNTDPDIRPLTVRDVRTDSFFVGQAVEYIQYGILPVVHNEKTHLHLVQVRSMCHAVIEYRSGPGLYVINCEGERFCASNFELIPPCGKILEHIFCAGQRVILSNGFEAVIYHLVTKHRTVAAYIVKHISTGYKEQVDEIELSAKPVRGPEYTYDLSFPLHGYDVDPENEIQSFPTLGSHSNSSRSSGSSHSSSSARLQDFVPDSPAYPPESPDHRFVHRSPSFTTSVRWPYQTAAWRPR